MEYGFPTRRRGPSGLDVKGLSAAAAAFLVRVLELETFLQAFSRVVEGCAVEKAQVFAVHDNRHTLRFEDPVLRPNFIGEFQRICQP